MSNLEKIKEGLEKAYKDLVEYKKYKKTPLIIARKGKIIKVSPYKINTKELVYK